MSGPAGPSPFEARRRGERLRVTDHYGDISLPETSPAQQELIVGHRKPLRLGGMQHPGRISYRNSSALMISLAPFTNERLRWAVSIRSRHWRNPDELPPMLREPLRVRALHLHSGQRLRHILADEFLPVRPRRRIRAQNVVTAFGVIELDEGGAAVAGVTLTPCRARGR